ncbi:MAG: SBBP repeat-containing protein [Fluviicola sp.]|nr:SBBP repeat-containing protein [Fluviicola sp.]
MKKISFLLFFSILFSSCPVDAQNYQWAYRVKGFYDQQTRSVTTDNSSGAIYTTGLFIWNTDFESASPLVSLWGGHDIFIQKFDQAGNQIWVKKVGTSSVDSGMSINVDSNGDILISGYFSGTADFDPGVAVYNLTSANGMDIFILKLDSNGDFIWARSLSGATGDDYSRSVTTDIANNVYLTGVFTGTIDFDPGVGVTNLTSLGGNDIFVLKLDSNGNFSWAVSYGGAQDDEAYSLAVDDSQNVFITGNYNGTVDFDPSPNIYNITSSGQNDIFIQKLDINGSFVWTESFGASLDDSGKSLTVDPLGNIYITGDFRGPVDFDPSASSYILDAGFYTDVFILKLNTNGDYLWANNLTGDNHIYSFGIDLDTNNSPYITGNFSGTADFDPSVNVSNHSSFGDADIFISKMDSNGLFSWSRSIGGIDFDNGRDINVDLSGNCFIVGSFQQSVDFDPNSGTQYLASNGVYDGFILKLSPPCTPINTNDVQIACNSYTWIDGNTYTSDNNTATYTLQNVNGCDSIITLNLTINNTTVGIDTQIACNSYTWIDGNTYTSDNNTATYTLQNVNGCDSIVTLNLTINNTTVGIDTQTACDSYTWIDGNTYNNSNTTAAYTLTNSNGCDSIVTLNLTITSIDTSITANGATLTANLSSGNYQWLDCDNGFNPITGATNQSYTATTNGSYAVTISSNGCTDTSSCVMVSTVNIEDIIFESDIMVYPNPTSDLITVEFGDLKDVQITITDLTGKIVYKTHQVEKQKVNVSLENLKEGNYIITINSNKISKRFKFIKLNH